VEERSLKKMSLKRKKLEEFYHKVEERVYNLEQWSKQFTELKNEEENKNMREEKKISLEKINEVQNLLNLIESSRFDTHPGLEAMRDLSDDSLEDFFTEEETNLLKAVLFKNKKES
jgi:uncharacterized membrane protein YjjP (DUF1212 family)